MEFMSGRGDGVVANPFPQNVSSYFRRPSKIVKSSSRNTSPKHQVRRRAASNVAGTRTRSVVDRQRASVPQWVRSDVPPARPVSWHSSPYGFDLSSCDYLSQQAVPDLTISPYAAAEVNGLVTPASYPMLDEPQIQELLTPLEQLSAEDSDLVTQQGNFDGLYWYGSAADKTNPFSFSQPTLQTTTGNEMWQWNLPLYHPRIPSAPTSPESLPILNQMYETIPYSESPKGQESDELIGMGLYDSPAQVQSTSLLFRDEPVNTSSSPRRSLKLEDSFEPPSDTLDQEGSVDSHSGEDDANHSNASGQEVSHGDHISPDLVGQSFFFEDTPDVGLFSAMNIGCTSSAEKWPTTTSYTGYAWI